MYEDFEISQLPPEVLKQLIDMGTITEEQAMLQGQMEQANQLRNTASPEMRGNGRVMVAANPLEHLGAGMQRYAGQQQQAANTTKQDALIEQLRTGRGKMADLIASMGKKPPGPFDYNPTSYVRK